MPPQRWALDVDWEEQAAPRALAVSLPFRDAHSGRWAPAMRLMRQVHQRHLLHAMVLAMAVGLAAASTVSSQPGMSGGDQDVQNASAAQLRPASAIVARVVPETRTSVHETTLIALPEEPAAPAAVRPVPELKSYEVEDGDNPFDLARSFGISEETLLAANSLGPDSVLQIGQKLLVPPVSGVVVSTQPGETAAAIASQWKLDLGKLLQINKLTSESLSLLPGEPLVLPDAQPPVQIYPDAADDDIKSAVAAPAKQQSQAAPQRARTGTVAPAAEAAPAPAPVNLRPAIHPVSGNFFPWGQCTYWAAQQRPDIGSRVIGNAASWLYSARAAGLATGTVPRVGAVVVYQPGAQGAAWTGHVAYVTSVNGSNFTISEMNFPYWGRVTTRASWAGGGVAFIY